MDGTLNATSPEQPKRRGGCTGRGFAPGRSGNPGGMSKVVAAARRRSAELTAEALEELAAIWRDKKNRTRDRIAALREILACGHAKVVARDGVDLADVQFLVQQINVVAGPVAGVSNSPVVAHVVLPLRPLLAPGEVVAEAVEAAS